MNRERGVMFDDTQMSATSCTIWKESRIAVEILLNFADPGHRIPHFRPTEATSLFHCQRVGDCLTVKYLYIPWTRVMSTFAALFGKTILIWTPCGDVHK